MANNERLQPRQERESLSAELENIRHEQQERLRESHETVDDKPEKSVESAKQEALEKASSAEKAKNRETKTSKEKRNDGPIPKAAREASFKSTMKQVQSEMNAPSRAFSKVIHNKAVDAVSSAVGNTIARPNAILSGSVFAFVLTLVVFLVARYYGYPLSGTETIASFTIGWMAGLVFDYLRLEIKGSN